MNIDVDGAMPPTFLRRFMLAVTGLTGLVAGVALGAIVLRPAAGIQEARVNRQHGSARAPRPGLRECATPALASRGR